MEKTCLQMIDLLDKKISEQETEKVRNNTIVQQETETICKKIQQVIDVVEGKSLAESQVKLDVRQPSKPTYRLTLTRDPVQNLHDQIVPSEQQISLNCYLEAIYFSPDTNYFNFKFSDGVTTHATYYDFKGKIMREAKIPAGSKPVKRIVVYFREGNHLSGFNFYDCDGKNLLATTNHSGEPCVTILEDNERIVGFRSAKQSDLFTYSARHIDFQFVIGRIA